MNVDFITAIKMFFANYANFKGRSTRAEYWWVMLFFVFLSTILSFFGKYGNILYYAISVACLIPNLAISTRRMHDTGKSGWLVVIYFIVMLCCSVWMLIEAGPLFIAASSGEALTPAQIESLGVTIGTSFAIACLVAVIFCIWWIVQMCKKSAPDNQYGPNPYGEI